MSHITPAQRVDELLAELSTLTIPLADYAHERGILVQTARQYASEGRLRTINTGTLVVRAGGAR